MKMVGATNGFIRWPFVYEGLLLGCFSAVIAFPAMGPVCGHFCRDRRFGYTAAVGHSPIHGAGAPVLGIFVLVGLLLVGIVGSLMAIRKFLRV